MVRSLPLTPVSAALLVALGAAGTVGMALVFEHVFGYAPCPLCLQERWPYYIGVPLALAVFYAARGGASRRSVMIGLFLLALLFIVSAGLGTYHAGVEWKLWAGPSDCSGGSVTSNAGGLMGQLQSQARIVRCDEAAWRFAGLSFAGWNAVISLALAAIATLGMPRR
ncbi:disulfide bond formation protein DsbB [Agaricicola taiwanensis]|uniref:Disulfide bond formation protein DsbB n=1 Tax=Agaricicola taiwanensis TaxID=591372 RepID=A0A8J2YKV6_9RHOB|nr:disulfide bond formation protein B [Agaricicola taiwanensis]GGE51317.1 disulfide bond formation protein DsbB [Agaricicola taiwanensis]